MTVPLGEPAVAAKLILAADEIIARCGACATGELQHPVDAGGGGEIAAAGDGEGEGG